MVIDSPIISGSLIVTGSAAFTGSLTLSGSMTAIGTITATTLVVQTVTSSISRITGSTSFGSSSINNHNFTGSLIVSGAMFVSSSGQVGIGTITPNSTFQVSRGGATFQVTDTNKNTSNSFSIYGYTQTSWAIATGNSGSFSGGEKIIITDSGNVGIGATSPSALLTLAKDNVIGINTSDGSDNGYLALAGAGGDGDNRGGHIYLSGNERGADAGTAIMAAGSVGSIQFRTGASVERARITSTGFFKASNTGTYHGVSGDYHEFRNNLNLPTLRLTNSRTSGGEELLRQEYTGFAPNTTNSWFIYSNDTSAARFYVSSNGGIGNFQANNVNLSDIRTKKDITPLESYWDKFKSIEIVKFKYKDQTHDDFNIGVIAQQVEEIAPEFIDVDGFGETPEDGIPLKTVYTADLYHATIKVLQEAMARIEELNAEIEALKAK